MNEVEKAQCMRLLVRVPYEDLRSLRDTVTQKQISSETIEETIYVIVDRSNTAKELLSRKRLEVKYLFKYLFHDAGIAINPKTRKSDQIEKILSYWKGLAEKELHFFPKHHMDRYLVNLVREHKKESSQQNKAQEHKPQQSVILETAILLWCIILFVLFTL